MCVSYDLDANNWWRKHRQTGKVSEILEQLNRKDEHIYQNPHFYCGGLYAVIRPAKLFYG